MVTDEDGFRYYAYHFVNEMRIIIELYKGGPSITHV